MLSKIRETVKPWFGGGSRASVAASRSVAAPADPRLAQFPSLHSFAKATGLQADQMVAAFAVEREFHHKIKAEPDPERRRQLSAEVYTRIFEIYGSKFGMNLDAPSGPKDDIVRLFKPELNGKDILDVGCGSGDFLLGCSRNLDHGRLLGIDVFAQDMDVPQRKLTFRRGDIVRFAVDALFDVVMTDNVIEHIAPQDIPDFLKSVHTALKPGGAFIVLTPNALFGPWDVTRIIDDTYSGWVPAEGTHLTETTWTDLVATMNQAGFGDFTTVHPKARMGLRDPAKRFGVNMMLRGERKPQLIRRLQSLPKGHLLPAYEICLIARKKTA